MRPFHKSPVDGVITRQPGLYQQFKPSCCKINANVNEAAAVICGWTSGKFFEFSASRWPVKISPNLAIIALSLARKSLGLAVEKIRDRLANNNGGTRWSCRFLFFGPQFPSKLGMPVNYTSAICCPSPFTCDDKIHRGVLRQARVVCLWIYFL